MTLINTDQRRHGGIRMANRAEKTNPLQASLRQVRFFSANPARGIIRAHPRYPWLISFQPLPASLLLSKNLLPRLFTSPATSKNTAADLSGFAKCSKTTPK